MKKIPALIGILVLLTIPLFAQEIEGDATSTFSDDKGPFSLGGLFGAVTVDGKNYQQIGLRPELAFGKFGLGLDITLLLDENGSPRKEDWDDWEDYLDKLYYIRWGSNGDPFFFRFGGLSSTTLGYGILINNYNNLREYPANKRLGLDIGFETRFVGGQAFIGNFKDLWRSDPGPLVGGRVFVKPIERLQIGASFAADFNEYNGLRDQDNDGTPDRMDQYPTDAKWQSTYGYYVDQMVNGPGKLSPTAAETAVDALVAAGAIEADPGKFTAPVTRSLFWAADAGFNILKTDFLRFDLYAQIAQSAETKGWGFTAPGVRLNLGEFLKIYGDYRMTGGKFLFGYYNDTYDLERASFIEADTTAGTPASVKTKSKRIDSAPPLFGFFAGLRFNAFNVVAITGEFQDLTEFGTSFHDFSMRANLAINPNLIPQIAIAEVYYIQNNIPELKWLTESTVLGAQVGLRISDGASINLEYNVTCIDKNGDTKITVGKETNMEFHVLTKVTF
jgi:hypothetical protein